MSGCSASCAQPQVGDIGLRGETYRDETGSREGVDVALGGDLGRDQFADWIATAVPTETIPETVEDLVTAFQEADAEAFADWTDAESNDELARLVSPAERTRPQEAD